MEVSTQKRIITPKDNVQSSSTSLMAQLRIPRLIFRLNLTFCLPSHRRSPAGIHFRNGMMYLQLQLFRSVLDACKLWQDPSWSGGLNAQWITNCAQFSEHKVSFLSIPTCCAHACTHIYAQLLEFSMYWGHVQLVSQSGKAYQITIFVHI